MGLIREPLLQFFLLGVIIFMVVEVQRPKVYDENLIRVDRDSLVRFYQFRTQSFSQNAAAELDQLSEQGMRDLINQFVREEALYRRALSYGMDKDDYVIRRRLVQKMEFLAEDDPESNRDVAESEIQAFYTEHAESFRQPGIMTLTHVFLSGDRHGADLLTAANKLLATLNKEQVSFSQAGRFGDRFAYLRNYVEFSEEELASHFGTEMAAELAGLAPHSTRWQGPVTSPYGAHLVLLTSLEPSYVPELNEVRGKIATKIIARRDKAYKQRFVEDVIKEYRIEVAPDYRSFLDTSQ